MTALQHARSTAAAIALLLATSSCHFPGRSKSEPIPIPDQPKPIAPKQNIPVAKPPAELPPPPPIAQKAPEVEPEVTKVIGEQPTPPRPKPKKKTVVKKPPPPVVAAPDSATAPENTPVPKLGEIITDEQRAGFLKACDSSLASARQNLNQIKGIKLTRDQAESVQRIRSFINQAQQNRGNDPQTARQLADRADLLSRDLVRILK